MSDLPPRLARDATLSAVALAATVLAWLLPLPPRPTAIALAIGAVVLLGLGPGTTRRAWTYDDGRQFILTEANLTFSFPLLYLAYQLHFNTCEVTLCQTTGDELLDLIYTEAGRSLIIELFCSSTIVGLVVASAATAALMWWWRLTA